MRNPFSESAGVLPRWMHAASLPVLLLTCLALVLFAIFDVLKEKKCNASFDLLNPRWRCVDEDPPLIKQYDELLQTLNWRIADWESKGEVSHVSLHFRNLVTGTSFGIQNQEKFAPASLLKVPVMIALLKYEDDHPGFLQQNLTVQEPLPPGQNVFDPEQTLVAGRSYTI